MISPRLLPDVTDFSPSNPGVLLTHVNMAPRCWLFGSEGDAYDSNCPPIRPHFSWFSTFFTCVFCFFCHESVWEIKKHVLVNVFHRVYKAPLTVAKGVRNKRSLKRVGCFWGTTYACHFVSVLTKFFEHLTKFYIESWDILDIEFHTLLSETCENKRLGASSIVYKKVRHPIQKNIS